MPSGLSEIGDVGPRLGAAEVWSHHKCLCGWPGVVVLVMEVAGQAEKGLKGLELHPGMGLSASPHSLDSNVPWTCGLILVPTPPGACSLSLGPVKNQTRLSRTQLWVLWSSRESSS